VRLLAVRDASERAVLPLDEDAGEDENVHQEPRVPLAEAQVHEGLDASGPDTVSEV